MNNNINTNIIIDLKNEISNIINDLNKENYQNVLNELFKLISNKNKINEDNINYNLNLNNFEILLNNQFTFVEIVVEKSIGEKNDNINIPLYAKLCHDLYIKFNCDFKNVICKRM